MRSKAAEKSLKQANDKCHYLLVPNCALALWGICKHEESIGKLNALRKHIDKFVRIDAIIALGQINHTEAENALLDSLYDSDYLVRYNALRFLTRNPENIECCKQTSDITKDESLTIQVNIKLK